VKKSRGQGSESEEGMKNAKMVLLIVGSRINLPQPSIQPVLS
jgi:hypothetical protein